MVAVLVTLGALSAWTGLALVGAPIALSRASWTLRYPRLALAAWASLLVGGVAALLGTLVWAVARTVSADDSAHSTASAGVVSMTVLAWLGLGAAGAVAAVVFTRVETFREQDRVAEENLILLAATARRHSLSGSVTVMHVDAEDPVAVSMPGAQRCIVVTSALERELTPDEMDAVLAHERAHLDQGHGRIAQLASFNAACAPRFVGARRLQRSASLLLELVADDTAARQGDPEAVASALLKLGTLRGDEAMLLRASRLRQRYAVAA